ncbi:MAG: hypothetical protein KGQ66_04660 [Acidobacteriota bacterium]|nr:hypothetical protein [Acidobacteriota bacterium]
MSEPHPVRQFLERLGTFDAYPRDVIAVSSLLPNFVDGILPGTAAFAGASGLYRPHGSTELPDFPYERLMVIGHNVDCIVKFEYRRDSKVSHGDQVPGHKTMGTWTGLYSLLKKANVPRREMFFTNVYVGLKEGEKPTGKFTRHPTPEFLGFCRDFLRLQVQTMQPRAILILGVEAWEQLWPVIDSPHAPSAVLPPPGAFRATLHGHRTWIVPAHHPSMQKRIGPDAEALRSVWHAERTSDRPSEADPLCPPQGQRSHTVPSCLSPLPSAATSPDASGR